MPLIRTHLSDPPYFNPSVSETLVEITAAFDGPPIIKKDLYGPPIGDPAENDQTLFQRPRDGARTEDRSHELAGAETDE